jgi:hypothetical protein
MKNNSIKILKETLAAYCDCNRAGSMDGRNLNFRASGSVSKEVAMTIMQSALALYGSYNEFTPEKLDLLPDDCQITLAREYSVCVYVKPALKTIPSMGQDETGNKNGETRIWWD